LYRRRFPARRLNAVDAAARGAEIRTGARVTRAIAATFGGWS